jgi:N-glycosylase/DNA lyase
MVKTSLSIKTPSNFDFKRTAYSHGWYDLRPFELDETVWRLSRTFEIGAKTPVWTSVFYEKGKLKIEAEADLDKKQQAELKRQIEHILRFDEDLDEFYELAQKDLAWVAANGAGRLLRAPTVWEDLVKTICTTNCSWALTKKMTNGLVEKLGDEAMNGRRGFPTPEKMAEMSSDFYREEIRAGYRAPYLQELAEKVASGKINVEGWLNSDLPTKDLKKEMKKVKGVGDYAAENLLKLLGRYDGLALDSWLRAQFYKRHNNDEICEDKQINRHYAHFGKWQGLAMWCDMTRDWLTNKN